MFIAREQVGLVGDRSSGSGTRIELAVVEAAGTREPHCLHEATVGNFARVFAGFIRVGDFSLPVAIKVQRDLALDQQANHSVEAKFDAERAIHQRLRQERRDDGLPERVVEHYEWGSSAAGEVVRLRPTILCPHARYALEPKCPHCRQPLEDDRWADGQGERALVCPACQRRYGANDERKAAIRDHTVRGDGACRGCEQPLAECRRSAQFLNFFTARVLLFELLDLDLDVYLRQRALPPESRPAPFWTRHARRIVPDGPPAVAELAERIDLLSQMLDGITRLHELQIAHRDLKPQNVCLRLRDGRLDVRLIDLGLADDPNTLEYLKQAQGEVRLDSFYAPPEMHVPSDKLTGRFEPAAPAGRVVLADRPLEHPTNPVLVPGDTIEVLGADKRLLGRARLAAVADDGLTLALDWLEAPAETTAQRVQLVVRPQRGPAVDLFSFGMLILALLTDHVEVKAIHQASADWMSCLAKIPPGTAAGNRDLVDHLQRHTDPGAVIFQQLVQQLDRYGPARFLAEEGMGIALRLVCRSWKSSWPAYLPHRGGDAAAALRALRSDWAGLAEAVRRLGQLLEARGLRQRLDGLTEKLLASLEKRCAADAAAPGQTAPAYDEAVLDEALLQLDLARGQPNQRAVLTRLRRHYGHNDQWLMDHLLRHQRGRTEGKSGEPVAALEIYQRALIEMVHLGLPTPLQPEDIQRFLASPRARTDRYIVGDRWSQQAVPVATFITTHATGLQTLASFVTRLNNLVLTRLRREADVQDTRRVEFELGFGLRKLLGEEQAFQALAALGQLPAEANRITEEVLKHGQEVLRNWPTVPQELRTALASCEASATARLKRLRKEQMAWNQSWQASLAALNQFADDMRRYLLRRWDRDKGGGFFRRLVGRRSYAEVKLGCELVDSRTRRDPDVALRKLNDLGLGPAVLAQTGILLEAQRLPGAQG